MATKIDPRGILRKIVAVDDTSQSDATLITFDCGHTSSMANHFHYKIGSNTHCYQCGKEARCAALVASS